MCIISRLNMILCVISHLDMLIIMHNFHLDLRMCAIFTWT